LLQALNTAWLPAASDLLKEGFPLRSAEFWRRGLRRLEAHPGNQEARVNIGQLMLAGGQAVGVALTPASLRHQPHGEPVRHINLSSWYIREPHRWRAALMLRQLMADPKAVYTDLTPSPEVARMLPLLGMRAVNTGVWIDPLLKHVMKPGPQGRLQRWQLGQALPAHAPSATLLQHHTELGAMSLVWETASLRQLIVLQPTRIRRVPAVRLAYAQSLSHFRLALPALARLLLPRGRLLVESDSRADMAAPGAWFRPRGVWYARGDEFTDRVDSLGTERFILDLN
jgi:hypothetical protein